jgi:hypothetical protein
MSYRPGQMHGNWEIYDSREEHRFYVAQGYSHDPNTGAQLIENIKPETTTTKEDNAENHP